VPHQPDAVQHVSGGIILASEGINGSICGTRESVETVLGFIQSDNRLNGLRQVESPVSPEEEAIHHGHTSSSPLAAGEDAPFRWDHVRVKLKKEVFTKPTQCLFYFYLSEFYGTIFIMSSRNYFNNFVHLPIR
jgi:hypothetical protein